MRFRICGGITLRHKTPCSTPTPYAPGSLWRELLKVALPVHLMTGTPWFGRDEVCWTQTTHAPGKNRLAMRFSTITAPLTRASARRIGLMIASAVPATMLIAAAPAQAHHGWDDFDTDRLYYAAGTVSEVRWGEPHSFFTVTVDGDLPADTPERELPEELQAPEDSGPINGAPSYSGSHNALEVVIAPPSYTGRWGLDRPLRDGERVELVGYINTSHDNEFRPVAFWYDNGRPVNQVLGSELPATPLPVPYPDATEEAPPAAAPSRDTSPTAVWAGLGVVLAAVVAGGAVYLRTRSRRT